MKCFGRASISDFLDDFVVYRNLTPIDPRLPSFKEIIKAQGKPIESIPRKTSPEYAELITHILSVARELETPGTRIERILFVGDTRLNDGTAFANICSAGNWTGAAFISSERDEPLQIEIIDQEIGTLFLANRWRGLEAFTNFCHQIDFHIDEHTAVLIDLDKTALGARGRNDQVIDHVRVEAAMLTVSNLLGKEFDPEGFQRAYHSLNQTEFHPFTSDNQDYLVYICLILGSGLIDLDWLVNEVRSDRMISFEQFIIQIDTQVEKLSRELRSIHEDIFARFEQGDPTPFKTFRYNEYLATAARMGQLSVETPVSELLSQEILITQEVLHEALAWQARGALLFGLSDKPDEASIPTDELASQGYKPIHQIETEIVGAVS